MTQAEIQTFPSMLFMGSTPPLPCLLAPWQSLITLFFPQEAVEKHIQNPRADLCRMLSVTWHPGYLKFGT